MKPKFTFTLLILVFCSIFSLQAQNPIYKEATLSHPAEQWNPVKLDADGNHVRNGVLFYKHAADCGSDRVKLFKLVNMNDYAVKVSIQYSPEDPQVIITIPASSSLEGACNSTDVNKSKLVFKVKPNMTEEEKKKNADFARDHIQVTRA